MDSVGRKRTGQRADAGFAPGSRAASRHLGVRFANHATAERSSLARISATLSRSSWRRCCSITPSTPKRREPPQAVRATWSTEPRHAPRRRPSSQSLEALPLACVVRRRRVARSANRLRRHPRCTWSRSRSAAAPVPFPSHLVEQSPPALFDLLVGRETSCRTRPPSEAERAGPKRAPREPRVRTLHRLGQRARFARACSGGLRSRSCLRFDGGGRSRSVRQHPHAERGSPGTGSRTLSRSRARPAAADTELDPASGRRGRQSRPLSPETDGWRNVTGETSDPSRSSWSGPRARRASSSSRASSASRGVEADVVVGAEERLDAEVAGARERDPLSPGDAFPPLDHQ